MHDHPLSTNRTTRDAEESTFHAIFTEQTVAEMQAILDWWESPNEKNELQQNSLLLLEQDVQEQHQHRQYQDEEDSSRFHLSSSLQSFGSFYEDARDADADDVPAGHHYLSPTKSTTAPYPISMTMPPDLCESSSHSSQLSLPGFDALQQQRCRTSTSSSSLTSSIGSMQPLAVTSNLTTCSSTNHVEGKIVEPFPKTKELSKMDRLRILAHLETVQLSDRMAMFLWESVPGSLTFWIWLTHRTSYELRQQFSTLLLTVLVLCVIVALLLVQLYLQRLLRSMDLLVENSLDITIKPLEAICVAMKTLQTSSRWDTMMECNAIDEYCLAHWW